MQSTTPDDRLGRALAAIDDANAGDPATLVVDGVEQPKEQAHARLMTEWVRRLDPTASDAQILAARAHHLRRWSLPRDAFPEGRAGYLRWRTQLKRQHAEEVGEILQRQGYDEDTIQRVQQIVRKEGLGRDPAVQVHEDALCLVFLQTQLVDVTGQLGDDKTVEVLQKTARKMSPEGLAAVAQLPLPPAATRILDLAFAPEP
ncbi:MAG TPA: DUF4202 domain-containing protein [Acidimicrobiales bacterium]|nr:DUF4202 domain-containing protein [Acidimicrobiales bacterium]